MRCARCAAHAALSSEALRLQPTHCAIACNGWLAGWLLGSLPAQRHWSALLLLCPSTFCWTRTRVRAAQQHARCQLQRPPPPCMHACMLPSIPSKSQMQPPSRHHSSIVALTFTSMPHTYGAPLRHPQCHITMHACMPHSRPQTYDPMRLCQTNAMTASVLTHAVAWRRMLNHAAPCTMHHAPWVVAHVHPLATPKLINIEIVFCEPPLPPFPIYLFEPA